MLLNLWSKAYARVSIYASYDQIFSYFYYMDALIRVSSNEFNEDLFKKIKSLINAIGNAEITISVSDITSSESKDQYWARIDKSVADIKDGKGQVFTMTELNDFIYKSVNK